MKLKEFEFTNRLCELLDKDNLVLPESLLEELEEIYINTRTEIALDDLEIAERIVRDYYASNADYMEVEDIIQDAYIDDDRLLELLKQHYSPVELTKILGKDI